MAHTIFITYQFEGTSYGKNKSLGYSTPIHCNYISKFIQKTLTSSTISFLFEDPTQFAFLVNPSGITTGMTGYGWSAYKLNILLQVVNATGDTVIPNSAAWKIFDVTNQTKGWISGQSLTVSGLTSTVYTINVADYNSSPTYDLSYLNYPTNLQTDRLAWGEEVFFFGNVKTDIKATAYTTDIPIVMSLNKFNSTTNPTWDHLSSVYVSEIGLYDVNNNLVAIGKIKKPITKNSSIARTILFGMDF